MKPINVKVLVDAHNVLYEQVVKEMARTGGKLSPELAQKYRESFQNLEPLIASGRLSMKF